MLANEAGSKLMQCQSLIDSNPDDVNIRSTEKDLMVKFLEAIRIEEEVARQKSRIQWLEAGDKDTQYFYNSIKGRRNKKRIVSLITPSSTTTST